jgi:hypothetical protein
MSPVIIAPVLPESLTLHIISCLVASDGSTIPERVRNVPAIALVGTLMTSVTGTKAGAAHAPDEIMLNDIITAITKNILFRILLKLLHHHLCEYL